MKPFVICDEMVGMLADGVFQIQIRKGCAYAYPVDGGAGFVYIAQAYGWLRLDIASPEKLVRQLADGVGRELQGLNIDAPETGLRYARDLLQNWLWAVDVVREYVEVEHGNDTG